MHMGAVLWSAVLHAALHSTQPLQPLQYVYIATLLYNLLWTNTKLDWTTDCDTTFNQLKRALVYAPVLAMPNFYTNFVVENRC